MKNEIIALTIFAVMGFGLVAFTNANDDKRIYIYEVCEQKNGDYLPCK